MAYDPVTSTADAPLEGGGEAPYGAQWKVLTPGMRAMGGKLGMVQQVLPKGSVGCPFHWHQEEDELFYVLSGRGLLRYGETVREIGPGDAVACPAGTRVAHQIANPNDEDLVYLAIGPREPNEICGYPDSGKVMVRTLQTVGRLEGTDYLDGERGQPAIFSMGTSSMESDAD